jgi:5'-nucleotidase
MVAILHTNDLHNCVGMIPRLSALVARERQCSPDALLLDAGDAALGGQDADLGVGLLKSLRYDALVTGNAENDVPEHRVNFSRVGAPVVVANIASGALGFPTVPYLIRDVGGTRLAILGLTALSPYPPGHRLHRPNAQEVPVHDAVEAACRWVPDLVDQADLVVVLSHLGLRDEVHLALQISGIDLIIGGHSHHRLPSLLRVGSTHIAQAGSGGAYLGVLSIETSGDGPQFSGRLEPVWQNIVEDEEAAGATLAYLTKRRPDALEIVGSTLEGCWADPWVENSWANFVTDRLCEYSGADIAFYGAMSVIPALDPGEVTLWDLGRCMPGAEWDEAMGIGGIVRMQLSGEAILEICEHSVSHLARDLHPQVPPQFCLPVGLLHASGLRVVFDLLRPQGERVAHLSVGGDAVDTRRIYSVATSGFLAKGYSGYRWFREGAGREVLDSVRSFAQASLREGTPLPELDGRLQFQMG